MMSEEVAVGVGDLRDLPYVVTIPIASHINSAKNVLESGGSVVPITVARVGEDLYPVDKMDVLFAHREIGRDTISCIMMDVDSLAEAQLLHINLSSSLPTNPFLISEAAKYIRNEKNGEAVGEIKDREYKKIDGLKLSDGIRDMMSTYISSLGSKMDHIPSFLAIFKMVSRLEPDDQTRAVGMVTRYCDKMAEIYNVYSLPEPSTLENIMDQFTQKTAAVETAGYDESPDITYEYDGDEYGDADDEYGSEGQSRPARESTVDVEVESEKPGYYHNPDGGSVDFRCECGREFIVNTKNRVINKREDRDNVVLLHGDYGAPMYAIKSEISEYLELALKPSTFYYPLSDERHGDSVIISKKRLSDDAISAIKAILNEE